MRTPLREISDFAANVLDGMDGPGFPAAPVFAILCAHLDSPGAVWQRTTWRTGETDIRAHGYGPAEVPLLVDATRRMRFQHPLMVANAAGDLTPASAQQAAGGGAAWRNSPARCFLKDLRGWDQMATLPLRGGPTEVCALAFGRARRDFADDELDLLAALQPFLLAIDRHAGLMARWRQETGTRRDEASNSAADAHLTGRELSVLLLLGEGLKAAAMARRLGCSPRTISKHVGNVYRKLQVSDRLSAVLEAQRRSILPGPSLVHDDGRG
ncbi:LuxR family transcriptional regulator [Blastococcus sp. CT_GayMR20]|uniref:helix-turn-helix transcriptional regulator n=1 Tax=Blastococcus sp. CT_GayMR20 TaxID=2559609 RepID=UPI001072FE52|nr:helix-turn-helix transcriptional regulator [Blastococcus sp. CT_GayMR20]TFV75054.1 LuxR family transcriptional regulator [Blastococcus sp. CT_GayMR20]